MLMSCLIAFLALRTGFGQHTDGDAFRFTLFLGTHSWNEVYSLCQSLGESMVHLHSQRDIDIFHTFTDDWTQNWLLTGDVWTGLLDNDPEGADFQFVFENCHTFYDDDTLWSDINTAEPNEKGVEKCVRFQPHDGLRTRRCDFHHFTVCQKNLGSCWFEDFAMKKLDLPTFTSNVSKVASLDECKQRCLTMNTTGNLCIAVEYLDTTCSLYRGAAVYINDAPAMNHSVSQVAVKRCFEGKYDATPPIVPFDLSKDPGKKCTFPSSGSSFMDTSVMQHTASETVMVPKDVLSNTASPSMLLTGPTYMATEPNSFIEPTETVLPFIEDTLAAIPLTAEITPLEATAAITTLTEVPTTAAITSLAGTAKITTLAEIHTSATITQLKATAEITLSEINTSATIAQLKATAEITTWAEILTTAATTQSLKDTAEITILASNPTTDVIAPSTSTYASMKPTTKLLSPSASTPSNDMANDTVTSSTIPAQCGFGDRQCVCIKYNAGDLAALEELIASLIVDKKGLSSYRRKKTSAPDHRVTATSIGNFGIAFLALVFISIILLDCGRVFGCVSKTKK